MIAVDLIALNEYSIALNEYSILISNNRPVAVGSRRINMYVNLIASYDE